MKEWFKKAHRRGVVDMHITDHDERFLSEFDPKEFVAMLKLAQVQSVVLYAHSHVGLCYYPTSLGEMHRGLKGRDIVSEMTDLCHREGLFVVIYMSVIFDTWAYQTHPDWRISGSDGQEAAAHSRYGICCPNSPYRDHIAGMAQEICNRIQFEGIRFDMTFWPRVCYCRHCQDRFRAETGLDLPKIVNWIDPTWVAFQRKREEWLLDFALHLTHAVKSLQPEVTVEHQASTYTADWRLGVTEALTEACDFLQGDFYGDSVQGSFARKLFLHLSQNQPYGFETSIGTDLANLTLLKPQELLLAKASASLADHGAFVFIDSILPTGRLMRRVYEKMGQIFEKTRGVEPHLAGEPCHDVGIYLSTRSKCDFTDNGKGVDAASGRVPHVDACVSSCKALLDHHIPFGVITRRNLKDLSKHPIVVLPNVLMMDEEEASCIREYVRAGGHIYASKWTSLTTTKGTRLPDFLLADVFGVTFAGETQESYTYIQPTPEGFGVMPEYGPDQPAGLPGTQLVVQAAPGAKILGQIVLPYTNPADPSRFASIHNNPPGIPTSHPSIVAHRFGKGQSIYVTGELENLEAHRPIFVRLLKRFASHFSFEADAPKSVEMTLFFDSERSRFLVSLVNFQKELPNIPVEGIRVRVRMDGQVPRRLVTLPDEDPLPFEIEEGYAAFTAPRLETYLMFALEMR